MRSIRLLLAMAGIALVLFGAFRFVTEIPSPALEGLATWLVVAVALHDGLLAPVTALAGLVISRLLPPRLARYVSGALVAGAGVSIIAVPLVWRQGTQPAAKALLQQHYALHLGWLWVAIGLVTAVLYAGRVVRDRRSS